MKQEKKSDVSLANLIAVASLATLGVLSFIGYSLKSGGKSVGIDVLVASVITAGSALLLFTLIKIKTAKNDLRKFRIIEYVALVLYIGYAIGLGAFPYHYFVVRANSQNIIDAAKKDNEQIEKWFDNYERAQKNAIVALRTNAETYKYKDNKSEKLKEFYANPERAILYDAAKVGVLKFEEDSSLYNSYVKKYLGEKKNIIKGAANFEKNVRNWSILDLSKQPAVITGLTARMQEFLSKTQGNGVEEIYERNGISDIRYIKPFDCEKIKTDNLKFSSTFASEGIFSILGVFILVFLHLLILFNYLVVPRTSVVRNTRQVADGGIILKND